jgi:AraC-like DNA-binding protein
MMQTPILQNFENGLTLTLNECKLDEPVTLRMVAPHGRMGCSFCLAGGMSTQVENVGCGGSIQGGVCGMWHAPGAVVNVAMPSGLTRWVDLEITVEHFLELLREDLGQLQPDLRTSLRAATPDALFHRRGLMDSGMSCLLERIASCPYQGRLRNLFLEGAALELLVAEVDRHAMLAPAPQVGSGREHKAVEQAKRLMRETYDSPLTMTSLARRVGVSESSLKRAFQRVCGTSVFAYYQARRLEQAREMLASGRGSVTEIAFAVGYSSHSHFSRAFKRQFGYPPRQCAPRPRPAHPQGGGVES